MNNRPVMMIIADDLTGALDSGVQLIRRGLHVAILTQIPSRQELETATDADVISVDSETRHIAADQAYDLVYRLTADALASGISVIYKKTDSGLRGNIGAELTAVLDASGKDHLNFIPAYPAMGRTTIHGVHYVNGKPASESIFASDPIDPVKTSRIDDLIHLERDVPVYSADQSGKGIRVYDAETDDDMQRIAETLQKENDLNICAGCAGFLEFYPLARSEPMNNSPTSTPSKLLVFCGSVNHVSRTQIAYAVGKGIPHISIPEKDLRKQAVDISELTQQLQQHKDEPAIVMDTMEQGNEETPRSNDAAVIAKQLGIIARHLTLAEPDRLMMIIGGDTLLGFARAMQVKKLVPVQEVFPGVVLAEYEAENETKYLITKSGGFGEEDQILKVLAWLKERSNKTNNHE